MLATSVPHSIRLSATSRAHDLRRQIASMGQLGLRHANYLRSRRNASSSISGVVGFESHSPGANASVASS